MRLVKKIKFNRIKEIVQFKKLESNFIKLKDKNFNGILGTVKDISRLNFYFVIEYINIIHERIDYNKIFPEGNGARHSIVDFDILMQEQDKLKKYINDKQLKGPEYFKKLGILNEVVGCFVVATIKKNIRSIKKLDFTKKEHSIAIKIDINKLPKEFEQICIDFSKHKQTFIEKEHEEFEKFMRLSNEEQDTIIQDILYNMQFPPIIFMDLPVENNDDECYQDIHFQDFYEPHTATTIEIAAENTIETTNNETFLNGMMQSALDNENYELCARIRDRLQVLKEKKEA